MKILAWIGLLITLPGLLLSYSSSAAMASSDSLGTGAGFVVTACLGTIGVLLAIIGGLFSKPAPAYFWLGSIVVGTIYIVSFYGYVFDLTTYFRAKVMLGLVVMLIPGLAYIIVGLVVRKHSKAVNQVSADK